MQDCQCLDGLMDSLLDSEHDIRDFLEGVLLQ